MSSTIASLRIFTLAALTLTLALSSATARACWDGHQASVGNVTLSSADTAWSPTRARELAAWLARIDALLPAGTTLSAEHGYVSLCPSDGPSCEEWEWDERSLAALFREVAVRAGASARTIRSARAIRRDVLVVQIAAFADRARADALETRISESGLGEPGFYEAGGFPANNPFAHVVEAASGGRVVHRVVVGAFVDRQQAERVREGLARELGARAIVRPL